MTIAVELPAAPVNQTQTQYQGQTQNQEQPQYTGTAADLALTGNQSNTNNSQSVANIRNSASYYSEMKGATIQVGDMSIQTTSVAISADYNPNYGEATIKGQIVIPLGQSKERRYVREVMKNRAAASMGQIAVSIKNNCMTMEQVKAIYPDRPELLAFAVDRPSVTAYEASRCMNPLPEPQDRGNTDREIEVLKQKLAVAEAELAAMKLRYQDTKDVRYDDHGKQIPKGATGQKVQGLW